MPQISMRPGIGVAQPDDALDRRGFAGAVRTEQAEDLAVPYVEADAAHRLDAVVPLTQIAYADL